MIKTGGEAKIICIADWNVSYPFISSRASNHQNNALIRKLILFPQKACLFLDQCPLDDAYKNHYKLQVA